MHLSTPFASGEVNPVFELADSAVATGVHHDVDKRILDGHDIHFSSKVSSIILLDCSRLGFQDLFELSIKLGERHSVSGDCTVRTLV